MIRYDGRLLITEIGLEQDGTAVTKSTRRKVKKLRNDLGILYLTLTPSHLIAISHKLADYTHPFYFGNKKQELKAQVRGEWQSKNRKHKLNYDGIQYRLLWLRENKGRKEIREVNINSEN